MNICSPNRCFLRFIDSSRVVKDMFSILFVACLQQNIKKRSNRMNVFFFLYFCCFEIG